MAGPSRARLERVKAVVAAWLRRCLFKRRALSDVDQARRLIDAVDRGGVPLNPAKVNAIARNLGLEVSVRAPVEQTIERIRACLQRADRATRLASSR